MAIGSKVTITFGDTGFPVDGVVSFDARTDVGGVVSTYIETGTAGAPVAFEFATGAFVTQILNYVTAFVNDYNGGVYDGDFLVTTTAQRQVVIEAKLLDITFENISIPAGSSIVIENVSAVVPVVSEGRINVISPFVVVAPIYNGVILETPLSAKFEVFIWSGLDTAIPPTPTYVVDKLPKFTGDNSLYINTNKYVLDFLEQNGTHDKSVWVLVNVATTTESGTTLQSSKQYLAFEGYNNHFDGLNYQNTSPIVYDNNVINVPTGSQHLIRICTAYNETTINFYSGVAGDVLEDSQVVPQGFDTDTIVFKDSQEGITKIDVIVNAVIVKTYSVNTISECKYTPIECLFINRHGVLQPLWFFKSSRENIKVKSKDYRSTNLTMVTDGSSNYMTSDVTQHKTRTFNVNGSKSITLNTGFIDEDNNVLIEQLMLSPYIWLNKDGNLTPVNIDKKSVELQTKINDKVIKYSAKFDYSFNINNKLV